VKLGGVHGARLANRPLFLRHAIGTPTIRWEEGQRQLDLWGDLRTRILREMLTPLMKGRIVEPEVGGILAAPSQYSRPEARAAIASPTGTIVAEQDAVLRSTLESVLSHQYEIIRPIGRGGMGSVYLARERALDRFVAIKVLRPDLAVSEGHRERFRREARIAARLSHPGILGLHSFGEIENLWYFVMTYVRGERDRKSVV